MWYWLESKQNCDGYWITTWMYEDRRMKFAFQIMGCRCIKSYVCCAID